MQLEALAQTHQDASGKESAARAVCAELDQRRQQLVNDNAACESAIGEVFQRKEVGLAILVNTLCCCYIMPC